MVILAALSSGVYHLSESMLQEEAVDFPEQPAVVVLRSSQEALDNPALEAVWPVYETDAHGVLRASRQTNVLQKFGLGVSWCWCFFKS